MSELRRHPVWLKLGALWLSVMMLTWTLVPTAALGALPHLQEQAEPLLIGVLELDANNVDPGEARAIAERLRLYLGRQPMFEVIERNKMNSIMEELGFQISGACDTEECVVQVGKILGARKMVAGSVSKVGNLYSLQVRIVDIQSSRIEEQAFADVNGIEQVLTLATDSVARQLAQFILAQQEETVPEPQVPVTEEVQQPPVEEPPAQEEARPEEEAGAAQKEGGSKWWLWLLLVGLAGGGAAVGLSSGDPGGDSGASSISLPPNRPPPSY